MKLSRTVQVVLAIAISPQSNLLVSGQRRIRAKPASAASTTSQWSFRAKNDKKVHRHLADVQYGHLYSDASCLGDSCNVGPVCIELNNENANDDEKLTIGDCNGLGWRLDSDGLFHSEADDNQCMQAGRHDAPVDGNKIRMFQCDSSNELQKFVYENYQLIKPVSDTSLCVVWQGINPNFGHDDIILRKCSKVIERAAWSGDLPVESPDSSDEDGCTHHEVTVLARGHQGDNSADPDSILERNIDAVYVTQVTGTEALFDGYNTLGYTKCNAASYLNFPSMPDIFGQSEEEWGITCTTVLLNQDKSDGSMSQLIAGVV
jgi:hypothetical protein